MIKVYVAGSTRAKERARAFMDRVRAHGDMVISYDWVADVDAGDAAGIADSALPDRKRAEFARADLDAVASCDVLVVLAEETATGRGMWVELGFALGLRASASYLSGRYAPAIIVSGGGKRSIFTSPAGLVDFEVSFAVGEHDAEAWEVLSKFADDFEGDDRWRLIRSATELARRARVGLVGVRCGVCGVRRDTEGGAS